MPDAKFFAPGPNGSLQQWDVVTRTWRPMRTPDPLPPLEGGSLLIAVIAVAFAVGCAVGWLAHAVALQWWS